MELKRTGIQDGAKHYVSRFDLIKTAEELCADNTTPDSAVFIGTNSPLCFALYGMQCRITKASEWAKQFVIVKVIVPGHNAVNAPDNTIVCNDLRGSQYKSSYED